MAVVAIVVVAWSWSWSLSTRPGCCRRRGCGCPLVVVTTVAWLLLLLPLSCRCHVVVILTAAWPRVQVPLRSHSRCVALDADVLLNRATSPHPRRCPRRPRLASPVHTPPVLASPSSPPQCGRGRCVAVVAAFVVALAVAAHSSWSRSSLGCCSCRIVCCRVVIAATGVRVAATWLGWWRLVRGRCGVDGVNVVTWWLAGGCGLRVRKGRGRRQWLRLPLSCPGL
jgi:hypothetical protein